MVKKKPTFLRRLSLLTITLVLLVLSTGYVVSINPQWLSTFIEKKLSQQGINSSIAKLTGEWQGTEYHLEGTLLADFSKGSVSHANISLLADGSALWKNDSFVERLTVSISDVNVTIDNLAKPQVSDDSVDNDYSSFFPKKWSLHCSACDITYQKHNFSGNVAVKGQSNQTGTASLSDKQLGSLDLKYDASLQSLIVQSDDLNFKSLTGYPMRLRDVDAKFNVSELMKSQLTAKVNYQGIESSVSLKGEGENHSRLAISTQGNTQALNLVREGEQLRIQTQHMDMALINYIQPAVMPFLLSGLSSNEQSNLRSLVFTGEVSGEIILQANAEYKILPIRADVELIQFGLQTDKHALNHVSGQLNYRHNFLDYQLKFNDSTLKLDDYLTNPLTAIQGETKGTLDLQKKSWLPERVSLSSASFQSLSLQQIGEDIDIEANQLNSLLINELKSRLLPNFSTQIPPQVLVLLSVLSVDGKISFKALVNAKTYQPKKVEVGLQQVGLKLGKRQLTGLSGKISHANGLLDFQIALEKSIVVLPEVFTESLPPTNGKISGQFEIDNRQVSIYQLSLKNKDFDGAKASGVASFKDDKAVVDFSGDVTNFSLNRLPLYLTRFFPSETHSFLSEALLSGKKNTGTFALKGDLASFMETGFVFKINVDANDGVFHYLSNNPDIEIKKTNINIDGKKLLVTVDEANLFTRINKKMIKAPLTGTAVIEDMNVAEIDIKAIVKSHSIQRLARIAERSLAGKKVKEIKAIAAIKGKFDLALDLWLDLHSKTSKEKFTVRLNSSNASVRLKKYPKLVVNNAKATAVLNGKGLKKITIDGKNNGQPMVIDIAPFIQKKNSGIGVQVKAKQADTLSVFSQLDFLNKQQVKLLKKHQVISGKTDAQVAIRLQNDGELIDVKVKGDIHQTMFNTFGLLAHQPLVIYPLRLDYQAQNRSLTISIDNELYFTAGLDKNGSLNGFVINNRDGKKKYRKGSGYINWYAQRFDFAKFKLLYDAWPVGKKKSSSSLQIKTDILIDRVRVNDDTFEPIQIKGNLDNLQISSPLISGNISYKNNHLQANLGRIEVDNLFNLFKKQEVNPEGREVTKIDLARDLPALTIDAEQLIVNGNNVGSAVINTSIQKGRYSIDQLLLNGRDYYFDASGYEAQEKQGLATHIFADFKAENVHDIIKRFGLNEIVDAKYIDVSLDLSWPGKASILNLRQSYGKATLNAENIKMVNVSSGVGSVFGMMDIVGILKRVSLDFDNLNSSKLAFDTIQGRWNIGGGRAMTRNAYATGSLVDIKLVGGADLHRRQFDDMDLKVIPKASNVIPIIGAVAGGVVGGAAGLFVQQAIGDNINRVAGLPYVISGQWKNPIVTFSSNSVK